MDYINMSNDELEVLVNKKDGEAICELAERYMYGKGGCEKNLTRAYQLLHKGEKLNLKRAYIYLGQMYENGIYFAKNEDLAKEYYAKAGYNPVKKKDQGEGGGTKTQQQQPIILEPIVYDMCVSLDSINRNLSKLETLTEQGQLNTVKKACGDILNSLNEVQSGRMVCSGDGDVDVICADTYWILTHVAFIEQSVNEFENYLSMDGVIARHPWSAYLAVSMHINVVVTDNVLEQDLQTLLQVTDKNPNFTTSQKADAEMMIGNLIIHGYGRNSGCNHAMAYDYYNRAASKGNQYAKNQLSQFGYNQNGELVFMGQIYKWRTKR